MEKRFLTLFVLTNDASRTKQFRIPFKFAKAAGALSIVFTLVFSFIILDYVRLKSHALELYRLKQENISQKIELQGFASKIKDMESQLTRLNIFDKKLRIIANIEKPKAGGAQDELLGIGGDSSKEAEDYLSAPGAKVDKLVKQMSEDMTNIEGKANSQEKSFTELHEYLMKKSSFLAATPSIWPVRGWVTSPFGQRVSPYTGLPQMHKGLDIANRPGSPVVAPADGIVIKSAWESGLGKTLTIRHGYGVATIYGHLSETFVRLGQKVKRGQKIGAVGNTGHSTGPHLHYEVALNGVEVNPARYILE